MTPDAILAHPPRVLSQAQREAYFETGYAMVESLIPAEVIDGLLAVTDGFVARSRTMTASDGDTVLAPELVGWCRGVGFFRAGAWELELGAMGTLGYGSRQQLGFAE